MFPIFLSVIYVVQNRAEDLPSLVGEAVAFLEKTVSDYELILVDNASTDPSTAKYMELTGQEGFPNLQTYVLSKEMDADTAASVGLENALGDYVAIIDPMTEDIHFLADMLKKAEDGADVVFARNQHKIQQGTLYRIAHSAFNWLYESLHGIHLTDEAPQYRLLNKRAVNFILQHQVPAVMYRYLPKVGGLVCTKLNYTSSPRSHHSRSLLSSIDQGIQLLVGTSGTPLRLVTYLSLFGAIINLFYSGYVLLITLLKDDVAPGWASLSLQQSGMFFLLSLVLMVLGEYISHILNSSHKGPSYFIAHDFTSARVSHKEKLNVEEAGQ